MRRIKVIFSPLFTLIAIQIIWILLVVLWVRWFILRHNEFRRIAEQYRPELVPSHLNWPVLAGGLAMLLLVLAGMYALFLYWKRQSSLYDEQKSFISQITHELKSPLASIKLHLETIRMRQLPPDRMERFLDTMLVDTDRLNNLINNLLMTAKLEQLIRHNIYPAMNFSSFVEKSIEENRKLIPEGGSLSAYLEPGIMVAADPEGMSMVIRNLLENAVLYSLATPEVKVTLKHAGKNCILTVQDNGKGISRQEAKKIFTKFYRVRQAGETIKGTGLGLYIVKSVVRNHRGSVAVQSAGEGCGSSFNITLPLASDAKAQRDEP